MSAQQTGIAPVNGNVLKIVSGLHAGATRSLAEQEMLVVGSGDDCDIVLADTGVAAHHALITLVGGTFTLRALDAPLRVEGKPLHPGDPVELRPLQRIDLGEAAIAFGTGDEAAWAALFPGIAGSSERRRSTKPILRRLPMIAGAAVLAVALVAVVAALIPRRDNQMDTQAFLKSLIPQHQIARASTSVDVNGLPVLSGTVESNSTRARIQKQLNDAGITATLDLRTGEDMARDAREIFRAQGMDVETRYLGNGEVEVNGTLDPTALQTVLGSRAMGDLGIKLIPGKRVSSTDPSQSQAAPGADVAVDEGPPVDIVSVVKGKEPYVVDSAGVQYPVGESIPGHGRLIAIGSAIWVMGSSGEVKQVRPMTAEEIAARAQVAAAPGAQADSNDGAPAAGSGAPGQQIVNKAQTQSRAGSTAVDAKNSQRL